MGKPVSIEMLGYHRHNRCVLSLALCSLQNMRDITSYPVNKIICVSQNNSVGMLVVPFWMCIGRDVRITSCNRSHMRYFR